MRVQHVVALLPAVVLALSGCSAPESLPPDGAFEDWDLRALGERGRAAGFNLLVISVDTLRADHVGCYGDAAARTPAIDALAGNGVRFDHAVCSVPITLPSHSTLMTGLDPPSHGVRLNGTFRLSDEHRTLAEALRSNGYATAAAVGAFVLDGRYGLGQGFEHYDDAIPPRAAGSVGEFNERPADRVTDAAVDWLGAHLASRSRPFFFWAHYYDPHIPYAPPSPYAEEFQDRPYDGEIAFTDVQIGRLIEFLRDRSALADTLVVFAGDHGEGLGDHGEETHQDLIYDSTMRVPLIFSNATLFGGGVVVEDRVAGLVDVVPTVLDLLGVDHEAEGFDGLNVMTAAPDTERAVYIESLAGYLDYGWAPLHGLRRVGDKFIGGAAPEYYDLLEDPEELRNLYRTGRPAVAALERRLQRRLADQATAEQARSQQQQPDAEELERLAALGYVRGRTPAAQTPVDPQTMADVAERVERAIALTSAGDHPAALAEIDTVLADHPDSSRALYVATSIYDALGRLGEGEAALRRALELQPKSDGWVHLAWYAFQRNDWPVFEAALVEAERLDPRDGRIFISLGHRYAQQGRYDEALALYRKAIEIDPTRATAEAEQAIAMIRALRGR